MKKKVGIVLALLLFAMFAAAQESSKNTGGPKKQRTGTMTVAGKTFTVTQQ